MREPKFKVNDKVYLFTMEKPIRIYVGIVSAICCQNYYEVIFYESNERFIVEESFLSLFDEKEKKLKIAELLGDTSI